MLNFLPSAVYARSDTLNHAMNATGDPADRQRSTAGVPIPSNCRGVGLPSGNMLLIWICNTAWNICEPSKNHAVARGTELWFWESTKAFDPSCMRISDMLLKSWVQQYTEQHAASISNCCNSIALNTLKLPIFCQDSWWLWETNVGS